MKLRRMVCVLVSLCLLISGGTLGAALAEEKVTLTLWACNSMVNADEMKMPEKEWYISKAIARFQQAHPNVQVEVSTYNDNAKVMSDFKAAALAGYGPDVTVFMNGPVLLTIKDGLLALNEFIDEDLRANLVGWNTCAEDMDDTKQIYGLPFGGQSVACFAFNRSLVARAGLDFDANPPRTIEQFYQALDAMKAAGVLPLHLDESYPGLLLYCLGMWWEQWSGLDGIVAHTIGDAKYTQDEGFLRMLEEYKKFYDNGWINEDAATSADQYNVFLQGGAALCTFGNWDVENFSEALGDDFGLLAVPTADEAFVDADTAVGGIGAALGVSNFSEHQDLAVEFAKHLVSRDELIEFYKVNYMIPARKDISAEDIGRTGDPMFARLFDMVPSIYFWPDNCMSSDACNIFYSFPCQVLVGNMTPMELAQRIDDAQED